MLHFNFFLILDIKKRKNRTLFISVSIMKGIPF